MFLCPEACFLHWAHFPFQWHSLVWHLLIISHFPRHNLGRKYTEAYLSRTVHDSVQFLVPFNLPWFFFSLLSVVFKGRLLLALFCWMSELWGCFFYATVCWCIKPEGLQNHICLGMIVLFQLGGLLIRSGEGNHSSLWSNPLLRSAWLCCSSSGQFENSVPCGSWLDGSIQLS